MILAATAFLAYLALSLVAGMLVGRALGTVGAVKAERGSNRLAILAVEIRKAHEATVLAQQTAVERARDAGTRLIEAKSLAGSKGWQAWLKTIGLNERTARDYMQVARLSDDKAATVADLGLRAALEAIRDEDRDDENPTEQPPAEWTEDQLERRNEAERGVAVVASMRDGVDQPLLAWAEGEGRLLRIDRQSDFGNPFEIPDDGDRDEVIAKFEKFYWPHKPALLEQVPELAGKVLACWCYPERCHGHTIAETINRVAAGDGTAQQIADEIADHDG